MHKLETKGISIPEIIERAVLLTGQSLSEKVLHLAEGVSVKVNGIVNDYTTNKIVLDLEDENGMALRKTLTDLPKETLQKILKTVMDRSEPKHRIKIAETVLGQELNKNQKRALIVGNKLSMPELLETYGFGKEEIELLARLNIVERRKKIYNVKDGLTGFRGKGRISSSFGMEFINKKIKGDKVFVFMDFDNMGPPNDFGLGDRVDEFIRIFADLAQKTFEDIPSEFLRLGGDEFGIVFPDTEEANEKYRLLFDQLNQKREAIFNTQNLGENFEKTVDKAFLRTGMRTIRKTFEEECEEANVEFTIPGFVAYLLDKGAELPQEAQNFSDERKIGILEKSFAQKNKEQQKTPTIMSVSHAAVRVGANPSTQIIGQAINQIETLIHQYKPKGEPIPKEIASLKPDIELNAEDAHQIQLYETVVQNIEALRKLYLKDPKKQKMLEPILQWRSYIDPAVPEAFRLSLVKNESVGELFQFNGSRAFSSLKVDIPYFGAINNNEGYAKADSIIKEIVNKMKYNIPLGHVFRLGGGELQFFIPQDDLSEKRLCELQTEINEFWETQEFLPQTVAEASEKQSLEEGNFENLTDEILFGSIEFQQEVRMLNSSQRLYQIF